MKTGNEKWVLMSIFFLPQMMKMIFSFYDSNNTILLICENVMTVHVKYTNGNVGSIYN